MDINFGIYQTLRHLVVNHPSSCISSLTNSESSIVTDTVSEIEEIVSNECEIDSLSERGAALVDFEFSTFKWEALHRESFRPCVDSKTCLKKGMQSSMQGSSNWGSLVQGETTASYHCPRISSNITSFVDIHQVKINQINSLPNRQQNSNFLSIENGGHSNSNNDSFIKRGLGSFVKKEHNYFTRIAYQCSN